MRSVGGAAARTSTQVAIARRHGGSSSGLFRHTAPRLGVSQLQDDIPTGSDRKINKYVWDWTPKSIGLVAGEQDTWFIRRKLQLEMGQEWDDLEPFRALPKPKKLLGNEACHVIWPYPWLIERTIKIHRFTKSIYVYYPHRSLTPTGETLRLIARHFSYEHLIPITFHNSQCYVETELLVEHSDTPWVVVNCLDGRSKIVPLTKSLLHDESLPTFKQIEDGHRELLNLVVSAADELGSTVKDVQATNYEFQTRPLQNAYVRVDYMWVPDRVEDRNEHLVQWTTDDASKKPLVRARDAAVHSWLNNDPENLPLSDSVTNTQTRDKRRLKPARLIAFTAARFVAAQRHTAKYGTAIGKASSS